MFGACTLPAASPKTASARSSSGRKTSKFGLRAAFAARIDAPPIANAAEPKTVWRRNDRREICRTHFSTSALKRAQDRLRRKLTTEECRQVESDGPRRFDRALFPAAGAGEQFVQTRFATIGGIAMNDAALGRFI